jgi:hypothetical protein
VKTATQLRSAQPIGYTSRPRRPSRALLTGVLGGAPDMLCSAAPGASPFGGMVAMYWLMSAFHLAPWLKLFSSRRSDARRS